MSDKSFAIGLMVAQGFLFSAEIALIHYTGPELSIAQFGFVRGIGGIAVAILFAGKINIFHTEQLKLHLIRGAAALAYGWVMVVSFGQLPLADATAISYTQSLYITLLSILILGEVISRLRWMSIAVGVIGALLIAKPSFAELGPVYLVALVGTSLNALNFVLNRYSNRRDTPETTTAYTSMAMVLGNLPLCLIFYPVVPSIWPWYTLFLILGPLGGFAGIVAAKYAEASILGPYTLLRLIIGILTGALFFLEIPDVQTSIGIVLITVSCVLALK